MHVYKKYAINFFLLPTHCLNYSVWLEVYTEEILLSKTMKINSEKNMYSTYIVNVCFKPSLKNVKFYPLFNLNYSCVIRYQHRLMKITAKRINIFRCWGVEFSETKAVKLIISHLKKSIFKVKYCQKNCRTHKWFMEVKNRLFHGIGISKQYQGQNGNIFMFSFQILNKIKFKV